MSSILRALKKLENEPRHQETTQSLDTKFVSLADTEPQRSAASTFLRVAGAGIICGLVILAGWWFLSEKPEPPPALSVSKNSPPAPAPVAAAVEEPAPASLPVEAEPPAGTETQAFEQNTEEITGAAEIAASPAEETIPAFDPEDISVADAQLVPQETIPAEELPEPVTNIQTSTPAERTAAVSSSPAPAAKPRAPEIPKLSDSEMKLQAITWSRTPQKRIAVINSRILREGDTVAGYYIQTINQDDVIVSQDGEKWKLLFR